MHKSKKNFLTFFTIALSLFLVSSIFTACNSASINQDSEETKSDYPVVGIWHAQSTWHENNPYNYGGDTYRLDIWFDFKADGTARNKYTLTYNGYTVQNSDWFIANGTWSVKGNVITLSNGKQFVIVDDEFNDIYNSNIILHFKKELSE